jgi:hypothetical protein
MNWYYNHKKHIKINTFISKFFDLLSNKNFYLNKKYLFCKIIFTLFNKNFNKFINCFKSKI